MSKKFATIRELTSFEMPCPTNKLTRFSAYGDSFKQAMEGLKQVCKHHGIPEPILHPHRGAYIMKK